MHLYGVGLMASLLALKRRYSREIAEMAEIAGMLHDLLTYVDRTEDTETTPTSVQIMRKKWCLIA